MKGRRKGPAEPQDGQNTYGDVECREGGHGRKRARVGVIALYFWPARRFGGPVFSNRDLCFELATRGLDVRVITSDSQTGLAKEARSDWVELDPGVKVRYCRGVCGRLFAPGMLVASGRLVRQVDAMYVWGFFVWLLPVIVILCWLWGVRLVVATGGMLSREALNVKPLRKRLFLLLVRLMRIERKAVFHVTSPGEGRDVIREIPGARVEVVPHGVRVPSRETVLAERSSSNREVQYFLVLGRLDPHKQVGRVIKAFSRALERDAVRQEAGNAGKRRWALLIAGAGSRDERQKLERVAKATETAEAVRFLGDVYGAEKNAVLAGAAFLVSGSRSENFGLGIAEALARAVPVIAARGCPWPDLNARGCGWWVEDSVDGLAAAFAQAMAVKEDERDRMGERGREWIASEFGWEQLGDRIESLLIGSALASTESCGCAKEGRVE